MGAYRFRRGGEDSSCVLRLVGRPGYQANQKQSPTIMRFLSPKQREASSRRASQHSSGRAWISWAHLAHLVGASQDSDQWWRLDSVRSPG